MKKTGLIVLASVLLTGSTIGPAITSGTFYRTAPVAIDRGTSELRQN